MRREQVNYLAVGLFVLAALAALLVILYQVSGRQGPTDEYYTYYRNVSGIKYGTGVFFEGYQIGQVDAIVPEHGPEGLRYRVVLSVRQGWPMPRDSVAKIIASGLLSAVSIDIQGGATDELLAPGSELPGQDQFNLFAAISDVAAQFRALSTNNLAPLLEQVGENLDALSREYVALSSESVRPLVDDLRRRLDDPLLWQRIDATAANLERASAGLRAVAVGREPGTVGSLVVRLDQAAADLGELVTRIEETRRNMDALLGGVGGLVADNRRPLSEAVADARSAFADLRAALAVIAERMDAVMYHLEGSARNAHELTRELRENPARIIRSAPPPEVP